MSKDRQGEGVITAGHARILLNYLRSQKLDPARLYPLPLLANIESGDSLTTIPLSAWEGMFETAIAATGDPALPLKVGGSVVTANYGVTGYLAMSCSKFSEAIAVMVRYERLTDDINYSELAVSGKRAELRWLPRHDYRTPSFAQLTLAAWAVQARQLTEKKDLVMETYFQFPQPQDLLPYRNIFKGPVHFAQKQTRMVFDARYLDLPIVSSNPEVRRQMEAQADALLREMGDEPEFLRELKTAVSRRLITGHVALTEVAQTLHVSPRTLQRRLDEHGLSFRDVLDGVRRSFAERHLKDPQISLSEVAFLLGYAEQSPFHHAFRRWFGESPGVYRKRLLGMAKAA